MIDIFQAGVAAVSGDNAVAREMQTREWPENVYLLAIGKAASSMTLGATQHLGTALVQGLVVTKYDHTESPLKTDDRLRCLESAHPVPDQASLDAGRQIVEFVSSVPDDALLLVLMSGGASSLVEHLPPSMELKDLSRVTEYMLSGGLDIGTMNVIRKSLSCIKGGRLAASLGKIEVVQFLISDVPGDDPATIGSGLFVASHPRAVDIELPDWLLALQSEVPEAPGPGSDLFANIDTRIVASSAMAQDAARSAASDAGYTLVECGESIDLDVGDVVEMLTRKLLDKAAPCGVYVWGGEPTLVLPADPGRGGRNQHLALSMAKRLSGTTDIDILVCGTDGTDGPTGDAGGLVSGQTMEKGASLGLSLDDHLSRADAGNYLEKTQALVTTGPTGTNVMDLVIALKR